MRIYVDFDDVLCETARYMADLAREFFDSQVPYEDIRHFNLRQSFTLNDHQFKTLMRHAHQPQSLASLPVTPDAVAGLKELRAAGHEITIVTGRPIESNRGSRAWLAEHGLETLPLIHLDKYGRIFSENLELLPQGASPSTAMTLDEFKELSFDLAIEDAPLALDLLAELQNCPVLIYDRPWNRSYPPHTNMRRVRSWQEIVEAVGGKAPAQWDNPLPG